MSWPRLPFPGEFDSNPCHPDNGGIAGPMRGGVLPFCDACGRMTEPVFGEMCEELPGCIMQAFGAVEHPSA